MATKHCRNTQHHKICSLTPKGRDVSTPPLPQKHVNIEKKVKTLYYPTDAQIYNS